MNRKTVRKLSSSRITKRRHSSRPVSLPPTLTVFTSDDYNSNDGMLTAIWGPGTWHFLHTMSFNYPTHPTDEQKDQYRHFILSLQHVLPCGKCRKNLVKNFRKLPLEWKHMESRDTFSRYIYQLHETVNQMLNKKNKLSYEDVRERYEHFRSRCTKSLKRWNNTRKRALARDHKQTAKHGEKGCTEPLYGEKSKCILKIVPNDFKCETLEIDEKCVKRKLDFSSPEIHK